MNINDFKTQVSEQEQRRLKAEREHKRSVWMGLGMFGMIGWSVAVPTLAGVALGIWLDKKFEQSFSWTLSLLLAGLVLGCIIAWNWIDKEHKQMHNKDENK